MIFKKSAALLLTGAFAASAFAQVDPAMPVGENEIEGQVTDIVGDVLVNKGERFANSFDEQALVAGDRVMAMNNSRAVIRHRDGCDQEVEENTIVTVADASPCAGGLLLVEPVSAAGGSIFAGLPPVVWGTALAITLYFIDLTRDDGDPFPAPLPPEPPASP